MSLLSLDAAAVAPGGVAMPDFSVQSTLRTEVNAPKPVYPLYQRDKRIHGLKPFQALVDAAPAGSVLRPPPGA